LALRLLAQHINNKELNFTKLLNKEFSTEVRPEKALSDEAKAALATHGRAMG
jgi:hypothetical protein